MSVASDYLLFGYLPYTSAGFAMPVFRDVGGCPGRYIAFADRPEAGGAIISDFEKLEDDIKIVPLPDHQSITRCKGQKWVDVLVVAEDEIIVGEKYDIWNRVKNKHHLFEILCFSIWHLAEECGSPDEVEKFRQIVARLERSQDFFENRNADSSEMLRMRPTLPARSELASIISVPRLRDIDNDQEQRLLQRAAIESNLGIALQRLGERENGNERLDDAIAAYSSALKVYSRECVPLEWAMTQNNLGAALRSASERGGGIQFLEMSVACHRASLEEYTRDRVPLDWAMTQNNLGAALQTLGERESGTARLQEAVAAYRAALEEWTRERVPLNWATTQNNLGNALQTLGERESGTARLEEAVAAYRAALEERTRERVPLDWATSLGNQGLAMRELAARTGDAALARQALMQIDTAEQTMREGGHAPFAEYFRTQIPAAKTLVERLTAALEPAAKP